VIVPVAWDTLGSGLSAGRASVDFAQSNPDLQSINAAIARAEAGVGDVHVAKFDAPIAAITEEMCPQGGAGCEVHARSSEWHVVVGKQRSAAQLKIWDDVSAGGEIPFQIQWIDTGSESGVGRLEDKEYGNCVNRILKSAFEKTRAMRAGKNPAITQAQIPYADVGRTSRDGVAAARPELDFVATIFEAGLSESQGSREHEEGEENCLHGFRKSRGTVYQRRSQRYSKDRGQTTPPIMCFFVV